MTAADTFVALFQRMDEPTARGKFLARLFGVFSEEIVRRWASDPRTPYENIDRPTLSHADLNCTLDFFFRCRSTGRQFVVEQKCEIEYRNYRYLRLERPDQLTHHNKPAFLAFMAAARGEVREARVRGKMESFEGAILIWGAVGAEGRRAVMAQTGLHDVIGLADVIEECVRLRIESYYELIDELRGWSADLFDFLGRTDLPCSNRSDPFQ